MSTGDLVLEGHMCDLPGLVPHKDGHADPCTCAGSCTRTHRAVPNYSGIISERQPKTRPFTAVQLNSVSFILAAWHMLHLSRILW